MGHPARLKARAEYWSKTLEEVKARVKGRFSRSKGSILIIPEEASDYLILAISGPLLYEVLQELCDVLRKRGYFVGLPCFEPFTWELLDVDAPLFTISIFLADGKYPLYRLLKTAFSLAAKPFERGEFRYPVRVFFADMRSGFDPALGPYSLAPLWLFAHMLRVTEQIGGEQLRLAHRLVLAAGYDRAREALATVARRSVERGLADQFKKFVSEMVERLTPVEYYALASLINLKRYALTGR